MSSATADGAGDTDPYTVDPHTVDELRGFATALATSGGAVARERLAEADGGGLGERTKSSRTDPVTVVDTAVEDHLRERVARERPGDRVLGEEGGDPVGTRSAGGVRWIVDPVDGTVNLLYGIPFTAVSVAAELDGRVVAGAVHQIATGDTWTAGAGRGAWWERADGSGVGLRASACRELGVALVGTGFSYDPGIRAQQGAVVAQLLPRVRDIRRLGSAALDLCMVASGRLDAYFERELKPWDHAAAALVAAEAGAVVVVPSDPMLPVTAAAPGVAEEFARALAEASGAVSN